MFFYRGDEIYAVRVGPYKAHFMTKAEYGDPKVTQHDPPLLYHLEHDPSEKYDVAKEHPEVIILLEGHCDERGTIEYNLALGEKRAKAVRDYLVTMGVASSRLRVTSYGESRPFALGSSETAWAKNRRAHFARP